MPAGQRLTISNGQAFDRYRRFVEDDVRHGAELIVGELEQLFLIQVLGSWSGRYSRRRNIIEGGRDYSDTLADTIARTLLTDRNRRSDEGFALPPEWDEDTSVLIQATTRNLHGIDMNDPHPYGPSLRRLWADARQRGRSGDAAWMHIYDWSRYIPIAFQHEMERSRRKEAPLGASHACLERPLEWTWTGNLSIPWEATADGAGWQVRLNDFPDELMYTLLIDGREIGDFHDWPEFWSRPGQPARAERTRKTQVATRTAAVHRGSSGRWPQRYGNGEYERVWDEMLGLGPDIRNKKFLSAAQSVARETMRRARNNIETLIARLTAVGYRFWEPEQVWQQPANDELAAWSKLYKHGLTLPLSLAAWIEEVGRVNLNGSHPTLAAMEGESHFQGLYADPLMIAPDAGWTVEEWDAARRNGDAGIEVVLGWGDIGKAGLYLDSQVDLMYTMAVPAPEADARVQHEWHNVDFVQYLRIAFRWGGFPGWERYQGRPERDLARLTDQLLPL